MNTDYLEELYELEDFDGLEDLDDFMGVTLDGWEEDAVTGPNWVPGPPGLGRGWRWLFRRGPLPQRIAFNTARAALTGGGALRRGPIRPPVGLGRVSPAQMDHFAALAAETEDDAEAEALTEALIPMAAKLMPKAGTAIQRVAPHLIQGATGAVKALRSHPGTQQLVRAMPTVVKRTAADIARQTARGRPVTGQAARKRLAQHTYNVLRSPQQIAQAMYRTCLYRWPGPWRRGPGRYPRPGPFRRGLGRYGRPGPFRRGLGWGAV